MSPSTKKPPLPKLDVLNEDMHALHPACRHPFRFFANFIQKYNPVPLEGKS
jgi:hypothetical protein